MNKFQNIFWPLVRTSVLVIVFLAAMVLVSRWRNRIEPPAVTDPSPVSGGVQILDLTAKGGYSPRQITAKAGISSVLKIKTNGTYDCSTALRIPALDYQTYLPPTGITEINIPPQKSGTTVTGICSMGMYSFRIRFE